jgi:hypothetical protein
MSPEALTDLKNSIREYLLTTSYSGPLTDEVLDKLVSFAALAKGPPPSRKNEEILLFNSIRNALADGLHVGYEIYGKQNAELLKKKFPK